MEQVFFGQNIGTFFFVNKYWNSLKVRTRYMQDIKGPAHLGWVQVGLTHLIRIGPLLYRSKQFISLTKKKIVHMLKRYIVTSNNYNMKRSGSLGFLLRCDGAAAMVDVVGRRIYRRCGSRITAFSFSKLTGVC